MKTNHQIAIAKIAKARASLLAAAEAAGVSLKPREDGFDSQNLIASGVPVVFDFAMSGDRWPRATGRISVVVGRAPLTKRFPERKAGFDFDEIVKEIARRIEAEKQDAAWMANAEAELKRLEEAAVRYRKDAERLGAELIVDHERNFYPPSLTVRGLSLTFENLTIERTREILQALNDFPEERSHAYEVRVR